MRNLKRTASLLLAVLLVVSVWLPVRSQAASAFLSGGGTVTVGEIFTVDYTISGSQLEGAAGSVTSSNPAVAQLVSVSIANGWSGIAGGSFSVYGDPIDGSTTVLRATFRAVAAGSCTISVTGVEITSWDDEQGKYTDSYPGDSSVSVTVTDPVQVTPEPPAISEAPAQSQETSSPSSTSTAEVSSQESPSSAQEERSSNANLASLHITNAEFTPAFDSSITEYSTVVPSVEETLLIEAVTEDSRASVSIQNNQLTPGETTAVRIVVTAEDGTTKTYTINATRANDPNGVALDANNRLSSLTVSAGVLSPAFDPEKKTYVVWLPYETTTLQVEAQAESARAVITIEGVAELKENADNVFRVICTAENGDKSVTEVHAKRGINPEGDPLLQADKVFTDDGELAAQITSMGEKYGEGVVLAQVEQLSAQVLNALAANPGVVLQLDYEGAQLRLVGRDVNKAVDTAGYAVGYSENPANAAQLLASCGQDNRAKAYSFGGAVLPGKAQLQVQTDYEENTLVNIYAYNPENGQILLVAEGVVVGAGGLVRYLSEVCYDSVVTTSVIDGAIPVEAAGMAVGGTPTWVLVICIVAAVLVGVGGGLGIAYAFFKSRYEEVEPPDGGPNGPENAWPNPPDDPEDGPAGYPNEMGGAGQADAAETSNDEWSGQEDTTTAATNNREDAGQTNAAGESQGTPQNAASSGYSAVYTGYAVEDNDEDDGYVDISSGSHGLRHVVREEDSNPAQRYGSEPVMRTNRRGGRRYRK